MPLEKLYLLRLGGFLQLKTNSKIRAEIIFDFRGIDGSGEPCSIGVKAVVFESFARLLPDLLVGWELNQETE